MTLEKLANGDYEYLEPGLMPDYDLYLSFTGGPVLDRLEREYGVARARALYCSVDPDLYYPQDVPRRWDLGYLGTYSDDRQPRVRELLMEPARQAPNRRFVVAGAQYPSAIQWPANVETVEHIPPAEHRAFYAAQAFTLNVTRDAMIASGYAPSVRLFEAAACGVPVISDYWPGLETLFEPGREVLIARGRDQVHDYLALPDSRRRAIGLRARRRVLRHHTAAHRARELVHHLDAAAAPADRLGAVVS
ncbi:MAG TPA: glycosyltransferase [Salinisphaera sp.]|nr:glycosyltransferase [Salinisphaera sp.]HET7315747.1 glycosyltransferase [Salinisphaera sp.]